MADLQSAQSGNSTTSKEQPPAKELPPVSSARGLFGTYKDHTSQEEIALTADILEGIAMRTQMFRIIERLSGDMLKDGYKVITGDAKADELCKNVRRKWPLSEERESIRDFFRYGTTFDFLQYARDQKTLLNVEGLSVKYLTPKFEEDILTYYEYVDSNGRLEVNEVSKCGFVKPKGEEFGYPLAMPAAATLQLLLNSAQDVGILIDRYAIPIVHWMLSSGIEVGNVKKKVTIQDVQLFRDELVKQKSGEDIVTDATAQAKILGVDGSVWNFDAAVSFLNETFHVICGVPAMLLGYGGVNKEIASRLLLMHWANIDGLRQEYGDQRVATLYRPLCEVNGFQDLDIEIKWPKNEIEERSQTIQWARPMFQDGAMRLGEYRELFGLSFEMPPETQTIQIPQGAVQAELGQQFLNNNQQKTEEPPVNENPDEE